MINHAIQTDVRQRCLETPVQKRVLQALASLADEDGEVNRSIADIAARAQACRRTTICVLHELAELGEIDILSPQRVRGHYRINNLPIGEEKPRIDSIRTPIVEAIRLLPLPVRISIIFQALAKYASRSGNNIFPSLKTLIRDTGYSKSTVQETLRWLLQVDFIKSDPDCINKKYQARVGYSIPRWNANAQILPIDDDQIEQIKALYRHHNRHYWENREASQDQTQENSTWLEDHSLDLDGHDSNSDEEAWPDDLDGELPTEESPPAAPTQEMELPAPATEEPQPLEESSLVAPLLHFRPETHSEMLRIALRPQRQPAPISLKQYHAALEAIQPHLDIVDNHDSGHAPVDESTLKKSLAILSFYERTISAYEAQMQQRE